VVRDLALKLDDANLQPSMLDLQVSKGSIAVFHRKLMDVRLLVQDAELIVSVDELDARVIARLNCLLVPEKSSVIKDDSLALEREHRALHVVDDRVEAIDGDNLLFDARLLLVVHDMSAVGVEAKIVALDCGAVAKLALLSQGLLLHLHLGAQHVRLTRQNLDALLHLRQRLRCTLDRVDIRIALVFNRFVKPCRLRKALFQLRQLRRNVQLGDFLHLDRFSETRGVLLVLGKLAHLRIQL
jgi:hypothetical protein